MKSNTKNVKVKNYNDDREATLTIDMFGKRLKVVGEKTKPKQLTFDTSDWQIYFNSTSSNLLEKFLSKQNKIRIELTNQHKDCFFTQIGMNEVSLTKINILRYNLENTISDNSKVR